MKYAILSTLVLLFVLSSCRNEEEPKPLSTDGTEQFFEKTQTPFYHGVASGDPLTDGVIIWTRITPKFNHPIEVEWELSTEPNFESILHMGKIKTDSTRDFTVKEDVSGLQPNTYYFYRFKHEGRFSPVGRTKTLPEGSTNEVNLAVVSCSNYEFGYFNAYKGIARDTLDAVLHLGDYIYEYAPGTYGDTAFERKHLPPKEILSLQDYRTRYAQYRLDKSLQMAHQMQPFIVIWDDHEIANNAYVDGAENHQPDEGDYMTRKQIAKRVYYEWQPIRETDNPTIYRSFGIGDLVDVIMLDERFIGRAAPPDSVELAEEPRSMLGEEQLEWFKDKLSNSQATWKVIGNQVIFSPSDLSLVRPQSPKNLDAWDGYAYERNHIIDFLEETPVENVVFVTGDTHASWAFEVPCDLGDYSKSGKSCATEIATTSISSANWNEYQVTDETAMQGEAALLQSNPHLKFVNGRDHGYTVLTLTPEEGRARWYYSVNIQELETDIVLAKDIRILKNSHKLVLE